MSVDQSVTGPDPESWENLTIKQRAFLSAFRGCGTITHAATAAGCNRRSHTDWMKQPDYAKAFEEAREDAAELLEAEARRRAVKGTTRIRFNPKTGEAFEELQYSDTLLIFLLKGALPEKYRERTETVSREIPVTEADAEEFAQRYGITRGSEIFGGGAGDNGTTNPFKEV